MKLLKRAKNSRTCHSHENQLIILSQIKPKSLNIDWYSKQRQQIFFCQEKYFGRILKLDDQLTIMTYQGYHSI